VPDRVQLLGHIADGAPLAMRIQWRKGSAECLKHVPALAARQGGDIAVRIGKPVQRGETLSIARMPLPEIIPIEPGGFHHGRGGALVVAAELIDGEAQGFFEFRANFGCRGL
jgi:hypothetical protein